MKRANSGARSADQWGFAELASEPWGPFGRGWVLKDFPLK
jgi:hypothetical protein